ncbi:MAG: hypothetical protein FJZ01_14585 [Candidatus Sericytochromatia bacterium]|nr:hypothetical protein [Candidatus Tanganyikabacteria bacterium]
MPKTKLRWRHALSASLALAVVAGCAKPPSTTPDSMGPGQGITVPVQPDSLGNRTDPSTVLPLPPAAAPVLPVAPVAPVLGMTVGAPVPLIPFVSYINGHFKLFVYDRTIADNYALPGAGEDIQNPTLFSNSRIVFERDFYGKGKIAFYDAVAELNVFFNDINGLGSVRRPSISFDGTVMTFLLEKYPEAFKGKAMIWINGVVADLAKVNAVGDLHGGITWIRLSCDARWATFTTADGHLFVYDVINPMVHEILDAQLVGDGYASHPAISPDGTQIAWADSSGFVYRYDRIANLTDPMPFLNSAFNAKFVTDPMFLCWDNAHIYAELYTKGATRYDKVWRVVEYNWITETIAGLTVLNNVLGDGVNLISDLED